MICTGCERAMEKATRRYKDKLYCASCYHTYFKKRPCPNCGEERRLPSFDHNAVCIACEKLKPCIRCGRRGRPLGKLTKYGPMCASCRNRDTRKPTAYKAQNPLLGTCPSCHRYRPLTTAKCGQKLCQKCLEIGTVRCTRCHRAMPAGRVSECESCYWDQLYEKRVAMNAAALSGTPFEGLWKDYAHWLKKRRGANRAALIVNRYIAFFLELLRLGKHIPPYFELVSHFGAEGLRRVRNVVTWLVDTGQIEVDEKIKNYVVEEQKVHRLTSIFDPNSCSAELLCHYNEYLQEKLDHNQTSMRSIRLALSPAVALLQRSYVEGRKPTQNDVDVFIKRRPGQFAAITGFINFLNRHTSLDIRLPPKPKRSGESRKRRLERQLLAIYSETSPDANDEVLWIELGLMYFHNVPKKQLKTIELIYEKDRDEGYWVSLGKERYWLPGMGDA